MNLLSNKRFDSFSRLMYGHETGMKPETVVLFLLCVILGTLPACATPLTYSAKEIRSQIVDAETDQPIEGAVIVAQWILFEMGVGHRKRLHIEETVTDKDGRYVIPAWGPKPHPPLTELDREDPMLAIFKSGYMPLRLYNRIDRSDSLRVSEWDGKVIRLKRFQGGLEDYARRLESFSIGLAHNGKEWRLFPRMILALDAENRRLKSQGLNPNYRTSIFEIEYFDEADRDYLRRYENAK